MAKNFRVKISPEADRDLENIAFWIAKETGLFGTALRYTQRIRSLIESLCVFPQRGTRRDDLSPGLRIIGFERRVALVFKIVDDTIQIVRVFYGGRDLAALLNENAALPGGESGAHDDSDFDEDD